MHDMPLAKKSLGQCFLTDKTRAKEIVAALGIRSGDTVVEIGPGRGILTEELVQTPAKIIAVEIDRRLQEPLQKKFGDFPNFELRSEDILETDFEAVLPQGLVKVVGNLPYHLSSRILYKILEYSRIARENDNLPWIDAAVLMMQKEVAERVVAKPGTKAYGKLSIFVQLECIATYMMTVSAKCFYPTPQVDGGVIRFDMLKIPPVYPRDRVLFERIVRFTFHQRRKMLKTTLSNLSGIHPFWQTLDFDFTRRPETLSVDEWVMLADGISQAQSA